MENGTAISSGTQIDTLSNVRAPTAMATLPYSTNANLTAE